MSSELKPTVANAILYPENFNGIPVGAFEAQVIREMEQDRRDARPVEKQYTRAEFDAIFFPIPKPYPKRIPELSAETKAAIARVRSAASLQDALRLAVKIPELFQVSPSGEAILFARENKHRDPELTPIGYRRHYATMVALIAKRGLISNHLIVRSTKHEAVHPRTYDGSALGLEDSTLYEGRFPNNGVSAILPGTTISAPVMFRSMDEKLTPPSLADAIEKLLTTGEITRVGDV